jgi:membrane protein DedA with SNARE-associated domain/rhodanese-related sulfurtransferase
VTYSLQLTYPIVLLAVFAQQLCLPIPSVVFLMGAGALSARGEMRTSIIVFLGVLGCLAADGIWFWLGRRWGSRPLQLLCRFSADPRRCSHNANEKFRRYGLPVLCIAKFFPGLDVVMPPLVGAQGAPLSGFLALDALGGFLWSGFYVGLGYLCSKQLDVAIPWVQHFGTVLGIAIGVPICLFAGWRGLALVRMIRRLRLRRISPPMLARKLKSSRKLAVLDLLNFEAESDTESSEAIPGALRVDPSLLQKSPHVTVPHGVDIVLYSSAGGDTVSARAAVSLKRIGVDNVWVLEGGLKAWRENGFPVSQSPEIPDVVARRVGVELPEAASGSE